jgi:hypothetical protein
LMRPSMASSPGTITPTPPSSKTLRLALRS